MKHTLQQGSDRVSRHWHVVRATCLSIALAGTTACAGEITIDVPHAPSPLPGAHGDVLVYELNVRNLDTTCARLVDVLAHGGSCASMIEQHYQGSAIPANTTAYTHDMTRVPDPPGRRLPEHGPPPVDVPPGGGVVVFFYIPVGDGKPAPASISHVLEFTSCDGKGAIRTVRHDMPLANETPAVVGLPFRGAGWVAGDSVNATGTHRRTLIPIRDASGKPLAGQFHVPERYAIDWIVTADDGERAKGAINRNESYLAFGKEIVAVADGTIARTRDGMPEQTPPKSPSGQTVETAGGNFIMQDIGNGHFAFYAHLQPGSLRVAPGDHVRRGQLIALLGNTGNSTEPHLHFHVSSTNDPLMSEGLPYVFDTFRSTGQVDGMNETTGLFDEVRRHDAVTRTAQMPASYSVLDADAAATPAPAAAAQTVPSKAR